MDMSTVNRRALALVRELDDYGENATLINVHADTGWGVSVDVRYKLRETVLGWTHTTALVGFADDGHAVLWAN